MNITEKLAGPHTGWLCWVDARQTQNSDYIDLSNKKFKKNKKNTFFFRSRNELGNWLQHRLVTYWSLFRAAGSRIKDTRMGKPAATPQTDNLWIAYGKIGIQMHKPLIMPYGRNLKEKQRQETYLFVKLEFIQIPIQSFIASFSLLSWEVYQPLYTAIFYPCWHRQPCW